MSDEVFPICKCEKTALRRRCTTSGSVLVGYQCLECGRCVEGVPKRSVANLYSLPWWDKSLEEKRKELVNAYHDRQRKAWESQRDAKNRNFWLRYEAHLRSDKWRELRRKVMARCNRTCEGCGVRPAVQVHHLTYDRLGNEMLFDLVGVCMECHKSIHPDME